MAKLSAWQALRNEIEKYYERVTAIPNPTAEETGERVACMTILWRMEVLEKRLDKA